MLYVDEIYEQEKVAFFRKSKERFGGLGNMAGGYPLTVNGISYSSSEALYQVARYPHHRDVQNKIIETHNGFAAKLVAKQHYDLTRPNWNSVRVAVMRNVLIIKAQQNYTKIKAIIDDTDDREIVEWSRKDPFWGAIPDHDILAGQNTLGKLWMFLRPSIADGSINMIVPITTWFPQGDDQLVDLIQY
jgi:type I restriction enzyme S subunit